METKELELRMYFFVPYNLSPIQQGIQAGHAALEYAWEYKDTILFRDFMINWGTWIILNGGTTNEKRDFDGVAQGTLNQIGDLLREKNVRFTYFQEPDLNDAVTALCFICDERVWDRERYPDFIDDLCKVKDFNAQQSIAVRVMDYSDLISEYAEEYDGWLNLMGGSKNVFLRDLIRDKRLA